MTFSEYAGTSIVPTLSRLVLALAFITAGFNKVFREADYNAEQATILKNMGVAVTPAPAVTLQAPVNHADPSAVTIVPAAYRLPQTQTAPAPTTRPAITNALAPGMYRAPAMYHIALTVHDQKWRIQPVHEKWLAWAAAYTELIGGIMILVGLLSRFWALGLSVVMIMAFYMVSMKPPFEVHKHIRDFAAWSMENPMNGSTVLVQLSLFVLAFGIVLTGAGPLSIDRLFFGGARRPINPAPPPPDRPNRLEPIGSMSMKR